MQWKRKSNARARHTGRANEVLRHSFTILCAVIISLSFVWLARSCAQSKTETQETRPRRVATDGSQAGSDARTDANANTRGGNNQMNEEKRKFAGPVGFYTALEGALASRGMRLEEVCAQNDPVARRILEDYGAVFVAGTKAQPPPFCIFKSEAQVVQFQNAARFKQAVIAGTQIELQPNAMDALLEARAEAQREGLDITPRGGTEAGRRSYADTVRLWDTRFLPALSYWMKRGRLTKAQVERLKSLPLTDQVREVLELEKQGIYFSKDFSKSILYSIAAPGSSQHIMMLALDVEQFMDERVRKILARHGWFQTVKSDLPHFTYLGLEEAELPSRGLEPVQSGSQLFWIPNVK
ncbi:MAG: hypothetical protein LC731_06595 [Acidobacteria bacterium]|nr:hypothetical protein [Acidobacteriota bacterium]